MQAVGEAETDGGTVNRANNWGAHRDHPGEPAAEVFVECVALAPSGGKFMRGALLRSGNLRQARHVHTGTEGLPCAGYYDCADRGVGVSVLHCSAHLGLEL